MKWPNYLMLIRHDVSEYNVLRAKKETDPLYQRFMRLFKNSSDGKETRELAHLLWLKYRLNCSGPNTPLVDTEAKQAYHTGQQLKKEFALPDVIFVSPYKRALDTLTGLKRGWPELNKVKWHKEERIREQEHGLATIYNDWRIFQTLHPEQRFLYEREGPYRYCYPQGENVPDVRDRSTLMVNTITRDWAGKNVLLVCHHLNILALRTHLERLDEEEFIRLDKEEKPINCGVTLYRGHPELGQNGRLVLEFYNKGY
ncbi:histidine phosphatase family protein [Patescibacteria group bacterium]|nr:histidine phosphatase family protein [Patescibacteria group bacterium]MBU2264713.1 histidine phosphatase family protein [Patescibacteria group bacterium]